MENIQVNLLDNQSKKEKDEILTKFILTQNNYVPSNIAMVNAPFYWQQGYRGKGIKIAVIDTGCIKHPNLPNIIGGKNFTDEGIDSANTYNLFISCWVVYLACTSIIITFITGRTYNSYIISYSIFNGLM